MSESQNTLREALAESFASKEAETTEDIQSQARFAAQEQEAQADNQQAAPDIQETAQIEQSQLQRPTHWKKEYLPMWDKLATGQPLSAEEARKLAEYSNQREKEFATGVSTYKTKADQAKALEDAVAPFLPDLQKNNIQPSQWIQNLGNAHKTLASGSEDQKIQMFGRLIHDYGINLPAFLQHIGVGQEQTQSVGIINELMSKIKSLEGNVNTVTSWREQQEQQAGLSAIQKFTDAEKYPHFEQVRETMAQILESGLAPDLDKAYEKAVRLSDEAWSAEQERQAQAIAAQNQQAQKAAAVAKAKAHAVSTKTTTPSGSTSSGTKDRRALLAEGLNSLSSGRV